MPIILFSAQGIVADVPAAALAAMTTCCDFAASTDCAGDVQPMTPITTLWSARPIQANFSGSYLRERSLIFSSRKVGCTISMTVPSFGAML